MRVGVIAIGLALAGCSFDWQVVERAPGNPFLGQGAYELTGVAEPALDEAVRRGFSSVAGASPCSGCGFRADIRVDAIILPNDQLGSDSILQATVTITEPHGAVDVVRFEPHLAHKNNWAPAERRTRILGESLGRSIAFYVVRRSTNKSTGS